VDIIGDEMKQSPKPGDTNQRMYAVGTTSGWVERRASDRRTSLAMGRLGGKARANCMSVEQRIALAKKARAARAARRQTSMPEKKVKQT